MALPKLCQDTKLVMCKAMPMNQYHVGGGVSDRRLIKKWPCAIVTINDWWGDK